MSRLVDGIKPYLIGAAAIVAGVTVLPQVSHRAPDKPAAAVSSVADPGSDCHATVVAEDGTPPPGTPRLDPQRLCDAFEQAERDWNPPDPINAREFCVEKGDIMWPFTEWGGGKEIRGGDLRHESGHGPLFGWAPPADEADMRAYRAQGSVCVCSACKRYRRGE